MKLAKLVRRWEPFDWWAFGVMLLSASYLGWQFFLRHPHRN